MGILDWVKWKLSGGPSTEELRKIPLMNEKWICPEFKFPFPDSKFSQLRKVSELYPGDNPTRDEVVMGFVLMYLGELGDIKRLACIVDKKTTPPTVLLRFPDRVEGDEVMSGVIMRCPRGSGYRYRLSPIEMVEYRDCFQRIGEIILTVFESRNVQIRTGSSVEFYFDEVNIKKEPTERGMNNPRPMVKRTDHISYFYYPLEKRVKLFSEHEEAEKWLSENLFGWSFNDFIDFIMEKEGDSRYMEIYCSEARKLLEKYNIY